jgi:DNA-directed RNA polymerase specialized sigma subunit
MYSSFTDNELVSLYRNETNKIKQDKIFNALLHRKRKGKNSWHLNILKHVQSELYKFSFCNYIDKDDLYQCVLDNFISAVNKEFNIEKNYCFSTYAWILIQNSINREIQKYKTKKRNTEMITTSNVEVNQQYGDNKVWGDVISSEQVGEIKTMDQTASFESRYFYSSIIKFLKKSLQQEEIIIDDNVKKDLLKFIKYKKSTIRDIAIKHNILVKDIVVLKEKLAKNLEKEIFTDMINLIECGVKEDKPLVDKFCVSKEQITKYRHKMNVNFSKVLGRMGLSTSELFV